MATALTKSVTRELVLDDQPYKVTISPQGVEIRRKGRRKGSSVSWDTIMRLGEVVQDQVAPVKAAEHDVPKAVASAIAEDLRTATRSLEKVGDRLREITGVPVALRSEIHPDHLYGEAEDHWYIEPLLTPAEVASVLRLSAKTVGRLPIQSLYIGGERRYRQSDVRRYLAGLDRSRY